jgi:hypothetical protein
MGKHNRPDEPVEGHRIGNKDPQKRGLDMTATQKREQEEQERRLNDGKK